jgi:hypothetical protein
MLVKTDPFDAYVTATHRPTGKTVRAGACVSRSMMKQKAMAGTLLRSVVMTDDAPSELIRKYDLSDGMTRIVDLRTGRELHGDDVTAVLDRGELEKIR